MLRLLCSAILAVLLLAPAWAAPAEVEWLKTLPGVKKLSQNDWGSAYEAHFELIGDGYATMEKVRLWMIKKGWKIKDEDRSAGGVMSRRLDGKREGRKFTVTATQQSGQPGRMSVGLQGK